MNATGRSGMSPLAVSSGGLEHVEVARRPRAVDNTWHDPTIQELLLITRGLAPHHVEVARSAPSADSPHHEAKIQELLLEALTLASAHAAPPERSPIPTQRRQAPRHEDVVAVVGGGRGVNGIRSDSGIIKTVEGITIYPPKTEGGSWRAVWYESDGRRAACRAVNEDAISRKLEPVRLRLAGLEPLSTATGAEWVAHYLSPGRLPADQQWASSYRAQRERHCKKVLAVIGDIPCNSIKVGHFQKIVNSANSATVGRQVQDLISTLVKVGIEAGYVNDPRLAKVHWQAGDRPGPPPRRQIAGQSKNYVNPADLPTHQDITRLAAATQDRTAEWWLELMPYVAAYSGVRLGEQMALTVEDIDVATRTVAVERKVIDAGGGLRLELPKNNVIRTTIYPEFTPTGYSLADQLSRRIEQAHRERAAGTNPHGLLFRSKRGLHLRQSSMWVMFEPAMRQAGWRSQHGRGTWTWHTLRHVFCTTALNEWGLDLTDVTRLAGHANSYITAERYLGTVSGALERAYSKTRRQADD